MLPKGVIATISAAILLIGHIASYFLINSITSVSPTQLGQIQSLIAPITMAGVMTAVKFAYENASLDLFKTPKANFLFAIFSIVVPAFAIFWLLWTLNKLRLDELDFVNAISIITTVEMFFGAIFVFVVDGVFSNVSKESGVHFSAGGDVAEPPRKKLTEATKKPERPANTGEIANK